MRTNPTSPASSPRDLLGPIRRGPAALRAPAALAFATLFAACGSGSLSLGDAAIPPDDGGTPTDAAIGRDLTSSACPGPSPAGCRSDKDCTANQACTPVNACRPSTCSCDATTGTWACTDDCLGGACIPRGNLACKGPNPQGCRQTGCPPNAFCDDTAGCAPSDCKCDPSTGQWICTEDCGGGVCVFIEPPPLCMGPSPAGCAQTGCGPGEQCDLKAGCAPSACKCDPGTGNWNCTKDCLGGVCVPFGPQKCAGDNPQGCRQTGCDAGFICDPNAGCNPSACKCDVNTGTWFCTADCGGGTCIPVMNNTCPAPNPQGCLNNGCPNGLRCDLNAGCVSSQCKCDFNSGAWVCTKDCGGGICVK